MNLKGNLHDTSRHYTTNDNLSTTLNRQVSNIITSMVCIEHQINSLNELRQRKCTEQTSNNKWEALKTKKESSLKVLWSRDKNNGQLNSREKRTSRQLNKMGRIMPHYSGMSVVAHYMFLLKDHFILSIKGHITCVCPNESNNVVFPNNNTLQAIQKDIHGKQTRKKRKKNPIPN